MEENKMVGNRSELVFLYDIKNANPNGDPDENRPRIDEETRRNIVTDVRLKRTIRDYILSLIDKKDKRVENQDIFVKEVRDEEGYLYDAKMRAKQFLKEEGKKKFYELRNEIKEKICKRCIDVRLFGAVIPLALKTKKSEEEKGSITFIGPVQFKFGISLHTVKDPILIRGTGAFADTYTEKNKKRQFTFREEWILPYSLISFYGIINENAAKETGLTENDVKLLLEGMWNGTKNLITRSKVGQVPRFLLRVIYKEDNYHIGDLEQKIKLLDNEGKEIDGEKGKKIRSISEVRVDITELLEILKKYKDKIEKIEYEVNEDVVFSLNGSEIKGSKLQEKLEDIVKNVQRLELETQKT